MKTKLESIVDCQQRSTEIKKLLKSLLDKAIKGESMTFSVVFGYYNDIVNHVNYIQDYIKNEHIILDPTQKSFEQKILDGEIKT